jgi:Aspartyl protease
MPCLSIQYNPKIGPQLQVTIWPPGFRPPPGSPIAPTIQTTYMALIDTGASCTCVTDKVIKGVPLNPIGKQNVSGVHGSQSTNSYQFQVGLLFPQALATTGAVHANVVGFSVSGVEFVSNANFDVLLGRDILCLGKLSMSFDGHAMFCI